MPTHSKLDQVKDLLASGKTEDAADLLLELTKAADDVNYSSALMLKNQLEQLQQDVIDGVVSDSEQRLNWAKISRRIIELARQVEKGEGPKKVGDLFPPVQNKKPVTSFPKWLLWGVPVVLLIGAVAVWNLTANDKDNGTDKPGTGVPVAPIKEEQTKTLSGKLVWHKSKRPVAGAILEFNSGAFGDTTKEDGTFSITFDKALYNRNNIPLVIKYGREKTVEDVWLHEDGIKSLSLKEE